MAAAPSPSLRERVRALALNQLQALLSYWRLYTAPLGADRDAFAQTALDYSKAYGVLDLPPLPPPVKEPSASLEDSHMRKRAAVEDRLRELSLPQLRALLYTWQLCPNRLPLDRHAFLQVALGYAHLHKVVELPPLPPPHAPAAASLARAEEEAAPRKRRLEEEEEEEEEEAGECAEREAKRGSVKRLRMASPAAPVPFSPAPFFRPRRRASTSTSPSLAAPSLKRPAEAEAPQRPYLLPVFQPPMERSKRAANGFYQHERVEAGLSHGMRMFLGIESFKPTPKESALKHDKWIRKSIESQKQAEERAEAARKAAREQRVAEEGAEEERKRQVRKAMEEADAAKLKTAEELGSDCLEAYKEVASKRDEFRKLKSEWDDSRRLDELWNEKETRRQLRDEYREIGHQLLLIYTRKVHEFVKVEAVSVADRVLEEACAVAAIRGWPEAATAA